MPLTLGASHSCSGTGSATISRPLGLRVTSTVPAWVAADPGTPPRLHRPGWITLASSIGSLPPVDLVVSPQLVYPLPDELTLVTWYLRPGVTAVIDEIVRPAVPNSSLEPWDRSPLHIIRNNDAKRTGTFAAITAFTYTVPAGRRLYVSSARVAIQRTVAATTADEASAWVKADSDFLAQLRFGSNVVGVAVSDQLNGGPLVLPPGAVVTGGSESWDTGGTLFFRIAFSGFLFDA